MTFTGNVGLSIALLAYVLMLLSLLTGDIQRGGGAYYAAVLAPIFWIALSIAFGSAISTGGMDWLTSSRGTQVALVLAAVFSIGLVAFFCLAIWNEPPSQIPKTMVGLRYWPLFVLPFFALLGAFFAINGGLAPTYLWRAPLLFSGGVALLAGAGLLMELLVSMQQRQWQRIEQMRERQSSRDRTIMAEVQARDTVQDFGRLLQFTNRYETPSIQALALQKALAHPDFTNQLAACLRNRWSGEALYFVDAHDPPDPHAIAEPLRDAILLMAARVRERMRTEDNMFDGTFDSDAQRILNAADRLAVQGVDYMPAIREYRAALDEPRQARHGAVKPPCRASIDQWLAAHARK